MNEEKLREIVSRLANVDQRQLSAETPLIGPLSGSFGRARLDANLRSQFGVSNPAVYSVNTFGELCSTLGVGTSLVSVPQAPVPSNVLPMEPIETGAEGSEVGVGADVESVSAMPEVPDYWEDDFYKATFTPREIAYALLRPSPRASFAAMWCAKEALRKADASLINADWKMIEVTHDDLGKPGFLVDGRRPAGTLSLSHTEEFAFAVFVSVAVRQPEPASKALEPSRPTPPEHRSGGSSIVAGLALLLSIAALVIGFLHR